MKASTLFCGGSGCCGVTVTTSAESLTYQYFNDTQDIIQKEEFDDILTLNSDLNETDDETEILPWKENDLCDSHLYSLRERRQSYSMSNVLDLHGDSIPILERRCTYPPSRTNKKSSPVFKGAPTKSRKYRKSIINDSFGDGIASTESFGNSSIKKLITKDGDEMENNAQTTDKVNRECPLCLGKENLKR